MKLLSTIAQADAYAFSFEYAPVDFVWANNTLTNYVKHHKHPIVPGCYSDDTQMSLAVAEVLCGPGPFTRESFADAFVQCFKRDPRAGYARGFHQFLTDVADGNELLAKIKPFSDKSGGAMRALPCGILPDVNEVISVCTTQAAITHNTAGGINSALAAALTAHYFIYNLGPKSSLCDFIQTYVPGDLHKPWLGPVGEKGAMSVRAAITAIAISSSLSELLKNCVAFTGDVDTVAAIALGAASASREFSNDLPAFLSDDLENGVYGRDYIAQLDSKLHMTTGSLYQGFASKGLKLTTVSNVPRVVVIESYAQWTGNTESQEFYEVPARLDLDAEEKTWFAQGGDTSGMTFGQYLQTKGAKPALVDKWVIRYQ